MRGAEKGEPRPKGVGKEPINWSPPVHIIVAFMHLDVVFGEQPTSQDFKNGSAAHSAEPSPLLPPPPSLGHDPDCS